MAVYQLKTAKEPPVKERGVIYWIRKNLLSSTTNILLTILSLYIIYIIVPPLIKWAFIDANFTGHAKSDCGGDGACWVFIREKLKMFIYGFFPEQQLWRANLTLFLGFVTIVIAVIEKVPKSIKIASIVILPIAAIVLLSGGIFGLEYIETNKWGGLLLTLVIATVGIVLSFPIGVLLAMGRQSKLPIIKTLSVSYIELIRGVPLITVLFMASVVLPLFFPEGMDFDKLVRALIGITLFQAAYVAENIRGGFQAIPKGQYEAADALGLTYGQKMRLIILPQAIKVAIPNLVGTFISLFKDTSLVMIIGLFDLLTMVKLTANDRDWLGFDTEGYVFVALIYWAFNFTMSRYSKHLEKKLDTNNRD
ncbi:MAG TPA: amino acid ABC transporter permease [Nitratifractor sp.]|nr:amino acid ABC transporter permease [Nitratifractor sp.]